MHVVVVARDALAAMVKFAAALMPLAQAMQDHHLVPEGAFGLDGRDVGNCQVEIRKIAGHIGPYDGCRVGVDC